MQTIPCNLDALSIAELDQFATDAPRLVIPAEVPAVLHDTCRTMLRNYAQAKMTAIGHRLDGRITTAVGYEDSCDRQYDRMPEALRW